MAVLPGLAARSVLSPQAGWANHCGVGLAGHWSRFETETNLWYSYSDKTVKRVDSREVWKSEAFILFYQQ